MVDRSHPLASRAAATAECAVATLTTTPPSRRLSVRAAPEHAGAVGDALGVALPLEPCRSVRSEDRIALWLGPDEWLLLADELAALPVAMSDASVVDVSHGFAGIRISGERAAWTINAFCALDLHEAAYPIGTCTRTLFGKAQIILWRRATNEFHIEVARSLASYVWDLLEEARHEFLG